MLTFLNVMSSVFQLGEDGTTQNVTSRDALCVPRRCKCHCNVHIVIQWRQWQAIKLQHQQTCSLFFFSRWKFPLYVCMSSQTTYPRYRYVRYIQYTPRIWQDIEHTHMASETQEFLSESLNLTILWLSGSPEDLNKSTLSLEWNSSSIWDICLQYNQCFSQNVCHHE